MPGGKIGGAKGLPQFLSNDKKWLCFLISTQPGKYQTLLKESLILNAKGFAPDSALVTL